MPLYHVKNTVTVGHDKTVSERLVEAKNKAQAVGFIADETIQADTVTNDELIRLTKEGVAVEYANQ